jgi:hypothetical protein
MPELAASAAAIAYYAITAVGSVSVGYLLLRLAAPDSRLLDEEHKLGYGAIAGLAIVVIAVLLDALITSWESVLLARGAFPFAFVLTSAASFVGLRIWFALTPSETTMVSLPMHPEFQSTPSQNILDDALELNLERVEVEVTLPQKGRAVKDVSFEDLYVGLSEAEKAEKRRKSMEKLLGTGA